MDYEKQIEFNRQEAERYGKLANHYRQEGDRVQWFGIVVIGFLIVLMGAILLIFPPGKTGKRPQGGEQFPVYDPTR